MTTGIETRDLLFVIKAGGAALGAQRAVCDLAANVARIRGDDLTKEAAAMEYRKVAHIGAAVRPLTRRARAAGLLPRLTIPEGWIKTGP